MSRYSFAVASAEYNIHNGGPRIVDYLGLFLLMKHMLGCKNTEPHNTPHAEPNLIAVYRLLPAQVASYTSSCADALTAQAERDSDSDSSETHSTLLHSSSCLCVSRLLGIHTTGTIVRSSLLSKSI